MASHKIQEIMQFIEAEHSANPGSDELVRALEGLCYALGFIGPLFIVYEPDKAGSASEPVSTQREPEF